MYLAVDIGGTKTLVAAFSDTGEQLESDKFPTPGNYEDFIKVLAETVAKLSTKEARYAGVAVPGRLDRDKGLVMGYGTLHWGPQEIQKDMEKVLDCPVVIENDAKLAGLSEAKNFAQYKNVLYVTIGTGISCALITEGHIDPAMADSEGGQILVEHEGKMVQWEDVSSGKAIVRRFGKRASEIEDAKIWKTIAREMSYGLLTLISVIQPDIVVMGGGVSTNFDKYAAYLEEELKRHETPLVPIPLIKPAVHPEEAVIYGCYELARQTDEKTA